MVVMFTTLGGDGEITVAKYTPTSATPLAKGKEAALIAARARFGAAETVNGSTRYLVPGLGALLGLEVSDGYFLRCQAINVFRSQVGAFLKGGAP